MTAWQTKCGLSVVLLLALLVSSNAVLGGEKSEDKPAVNPPKNADKVPVKAPAKAAPTETEEKPLPVVPKVVDKPAPVVAPEAGMNPMYLMELARVHASYNVHDQAEAMLKKALGLADKAELKSQIRQTLSGVLRNKGDLPGAAQILETELKDATAADKTRLVLQICDIHEQAKNYSEIEKQLIGVLAENKPDPANAAIRQEAQRRLVRVWQQQPGKIEQVIAAEEKLVAQDAKNEGALEILMSIYAIGLGEPAKAVSVYENMLALHPNDKDLLRSAANAYVRAQQPEKAVQAYEQLIKSVPESEGRQYAYQSAYLLLQAGKKEQAVVSFKTYLKGATTLPELMQAVSFFDQAGSLDDAEKTISQAQALVKSPAEKADLMLRLAELLESHKKVDDAEKQLLAVKNEFKDDKVIMAKTNGALFRLFERQNRLGDLKLNF